MRDIHVRFLAVVFFAVCLIFPLLGYAGMTSTNYQIQWDSVGAGGSDVGSSATYLLRDILGGVADGGSTSASYSLRSGYRQGVYDPVAAFAVYAQDKSSQVAAVSLSGLVITVTDSSGFSVGDLVVIVQDEGGGQVAAVGRILAVNAAPATVTIDEFSPSSASLTIDGSNDYLYKLSGSTMSFGSLSSSAVTTGIFAWQVTADVPQGYSVYIAENQDFQNADGEAIPDVSDGAVSAGNAEYGARSSDASLASSTFDTQDSPITTVLTQVASRSDNAFSARDFVTIKAAISSNTAGGSYGHTISVVYVGDY